MKRFHRAERRRARLMIAFCGGGGSGKTKSALRVAAGLGGSTAMIDTEYGRGELYSNEFEYDVSQLTAPFSPERYIDLMDEAAEIYDNLILDGISYEWSGTGGILEIHDRIASGSESKMSGFQAWNKVTPMHNSFLEAMVSSKCNLIACIRSKTSYVIEDTGSGKKAPRKVGMAPIQREGIDFEFMVFFMMSQNHMATAMKDITGLFDGKEPFMPTEETGLALLGYIQSGIDPAAADAKIAEQLIERINRIGHINELRAVWMKYQSSVDTLTEPFKQEVMDAFAAKRQSLEAGGKAPAAKTKPKRATKPGPDLLRQNIQRMVDSMSTGRRVIERGIVEVALKASGVDFEIEEYTFEMMHIDQLSRDALEAIEGAIKKMFDEFLVQRRRLTAMVLEIVHRVPSGADQLIGSLLVEADMQHDAVPISLDKLPLPVLNALQPLIEEGHARWLEKQKTAKPPKKKAAAKKAGSK